MALTMVAKPIRRLRLRRCLVLSSSMGSWPLGIGRLLNELATRSISRRQVDTERSLPGCTFLIGYMPGSRLGASRTAGYSRELTDRSTGYRLAAGVVKTGHEPVYTGQFSRHREVGSGASEAAFTSATRTRLAPRSTLSAKGLESAER